MLAQSQESVPEKSAEKRGAIKKGYMYEASYYHRA